MLFNSPTFRRSWNLKMHVQRYLAGLLLLIPSVSWADDIASLSDTELLAAAKLSGACGIIGQMASFQDSTKMPGGTEFLNRFMSTEAARLGWTLDQYLSNCRNALNTYQAYYDAADKNEKSH